jgi:hypothetical protein
LYSIRTQQEIAMTFPNAQENNDSRQRLERFVVGLSDDDLARSTPYGGTVAGLLAHLAFWDRRMIVLLRRWEANGVDESPIDADMINDALVPFWGALDGRAAAGLCLEAAAEIDAALETMSPELMAAVEASGNHFRFNRALHRDAHLADLARVLGEVG